MKGSPPGSSAWKILYTSVGLDGQLIEVSGVVIAPDLPPPTAGRHVVAWAHPTTGVGDRCAPSAFPEFFETIPHLTALMALDYVVVATDYPGLGTAGPHPYLVGLSEGRAVLDSVRAARNLPKAGAGKRFAAWGYSQGGHAALFAGQLAREYAAELTLAGVAAIAPPTDLAVAPAGRSCRARRPRPGRLRDVVLVAVSGLRGAARALHRRGQDPGDRSDRRRLHRDGRRGVSRGLRVAPSSGGLRCRGRLLRGAMEGSPGAEPARRRADRSPDLHRAGVGGPDRASLRNGRLHRWALHPGRDRRPRRSGGRGAHARRPDQRDRRDPVDARPVRRRPRALDLWPRAGRLSPRASPEAVGRSRGRSRHRRWLLEELGGPLRR